MATNVLITAPSFKNMHLRESGLLSSLLVLLFIAGIAIPLADFTSIARFRHIPPGGIEAVLLAAATAMLARIGRRWCWAAIAVLAALYLRRHHVDLPFIAAWLFWEAMAAAGQVINRRTQPAGTMELAARDVVSGLALWLGISILLSALGVGHAATLMTTLGIFAVVALALARRAPLASTMFGSLASTSPTERMLYGVLFAWLLILFARTNSVYAYDALWHIGRGEYVLAPTGSIFEPLGLVSPVHYFPKLMELLLLPFASLGDFSFLQGVLIGWLFLLAMLAAAISTEFMPDRRLAATVALLIATLPAIGNDPLTLKADLPAAFFLLFAFWQGTRWAEHGQPAAFAFALSGLALACSSKLTALPFAALLFAGMILIRVTHSPQPSNNGASKGAWITAAIALAVSLALVVRTWLLTGLPTIGPDALFKLWTGLGMTLKEPVGTLHWTRPQDWGDVIGIVTDMLARPTELPHVVFSWVGNYWVTLPLAAVIAARVAKETRGIKWSPSRILWLAGALLGLVLALAWRYHNRGGDGNYYGFALAMAAILGVTATGARLATRPLALSVLVACLVATSVFQAWQGFVIAGWGSPGTRPWDTRFSESCFDMRGERRSRNLGYGTARIAEYLAARPPETRVVSIADGITSYWAPGRIESLKHIREARKEVVESRESVANFLETTRTEYLLLSRDKPDGIPAWLHAGLKELISRNPDWIVVTDRDAWLVDIRERHSILLPAPDKDRTAPPR